MDLKQLYKWISPSGPHFEKVAYGLLIVVLVFLLPMIFSDDEPIAERDLVIEQLKGKEVDPIHGAKQTSEAKKLLALNRTGKYDQLELDLSMEQDQIAEDREQKKIDSLLAALAAKSTYSTLVEEPEIKQQVIAKPQVVYIDRPTRENKSHILTRKSGLKSSSSGKSKTSDKNSVEIQAIVYGDQRVTVGNRVMLRSTKIGSINGIQVSPDTYIYGYVQGIGSERVRLQVKSIITDQGEQPVNLKVYDASDFIEGIYSPDALSQSGAKEVQSDAVSTSSGTTVSMPIIGGSIKVAKKAIAQTSVTLKNKHRLILRSK